MQSRAPVDATCRKSSKTAKFIASGVARIRMRSVIQTLQAVRRPYVTSIAKATENKDAFQKSGSVGYYGINRGWRHRDHTACTVPFEQRRAR
jgi:hypothetical protein